MAKQIRIDEELWARLAAEAAASGLRPRELIEKAVRRYLGGQALARRFEQTPQLEGLTEDEVLQLAVREVKAYRAGK